MYAGTTSRAAPGGSAVLWYRRHRTCALRREATRVRLAGMVAMPSSSGGGASGPVFELQCVIHEGRHFPIDASFEAGAYTRPLLSST